MSADPRPLVIADQLEDVAALLRAQEQHNRTKAAGGACRCLFCRAEVYGARGWPKSATSGVSSQVSGGDPDYSPVESEAIDPDWLSGVDERLRKTLRLVDLACAELQRVVNKINARAGDEDQLPVGSGTCVRCSRVVRPTVERPEHIKSGFCEPCFDEWTYAGKPNRTDFIYDYQQHRQAA